MRKYPFIALLLFAFICMMASPNMPFFKKKKKKAAADSTAVVDSVLRDSAGNVVADTARMDSLQKAIWKHNQVVDDSIRLDSIARKKSGGVDAPVTYSASDSLVYDAKNKVAHQALQDLFASRRVTKTYIALLAGNVASDEGIIDLPLRPDVEDRPRQMVDTIHGKPAMTRYRVLERQEGTTRIALQPLTGRTHQLRVHCSHPLGLNAPIVGDMLYGTVSPRLMLHAQRLQFVHPITGQEIDITWDSPF